MTKSRMTLTSAVSDNHAAYFSVAWLSPTFRDVSEERRAARTLQLREAELQIVNDYARFPVARCDPAHR
jgi:hypothetical protein